MSSLLFHFVKKIHPNFVLLDISDDIYIEIMIFSLNSTVKQALSWKKLNS